MCPIPRGAPRVVVQREQLGDLLERETGRLRAPDEAQPMP